MITRCWITGYTKAKPQNLEGKLGAVALPVGNSYKDQVVMTVVQREKKAPSGAGKTLQGTVDRAYRSEQDCFAT